MCALQSSNSCSLSYATCAERRSEFRMLPDIFLSKNATANQPVGGEVRGHGVKMELADIVDTSKVVDIWYNRRLSAQPWRTVFRCPWLSPEVVGTARKLSAQLGRAESFVT